MHRSTLLSSLTRHKSAKSLDDVMNFLCLKKFLSHAVCLDKWKWKIPTNAKCKLSGAHQMPLLVRSVSSPNAAAMVWVEITSRECPYLVHHKFITVWLAQDELLGFVELFFNTLSFKIRLLFSAKWTRVPNSSQAQTWFVKKHNPNSTQVMALHKSGLFCSTIRNLQMKHTTVQICSKHTPHYEELLIQMVHRYTRSK